MQEGDQKVSLNYYLKPRAEMRLRSPILVQGLNL